MIRKIWEELLDFFSDREDMEEPIYDPVHFAAMIVIVLFAIGALFWLLWTLLVFGGGLIIKIGPALQVLFGGKALKDFGWVGYPYEQGVFDGFIANIVALLITFALVLAIWWIFRNPAPGKGRNPSQE